MAQRRQKDLLTRLADAGEEAFQLVASAPGADRVLGSALGVLHNMRDQLDALSKRVRGIEALESRVAKLERDVAKLSRGARASSPARASTSSRSKAPSRSTSSSRSSSTRRKT
jgi:hypothetical protein